MEPNLSQPIISQPQPAAVCSFCHQSLKPEYYFCPNCGKKVIDPPLSTSVSSQAWLYAFSIILPIICYLAVTKWQGYKYYKSSDAKTKQIGLIACVLLALSTVLTIWYATVWTENEISSVTSTINSQLGS